MNILKRFAANLRDSSRVLWQIGGYMQPHFRPHAMRAALGTGISMLAGVFGILSMLMMASLLEVLKGEEMPLASAEGTGAWFDLNTMGHQVLARGMAVFGAPDDRAIITAVTFVLAMVTVAGAVLFSMTSRRIWMSVRIKVGRGMQVALFDHLLRLQLGFHVRERMGSLISRLHQDVPGVTYVLPTLFDNLIRSPAMMAAFFCLLIRTNMMLTCVTIGSACLYLIGNVVLGRLTRRFVIAQSCTNADVMSKVQEGLLSVRLVKAFNAEQHEVDRLAAETQKLTRLELNGYMVEKELPEAIQRVLGILTLGVVGIVASNLVARGLLGREGMLLFMGATMGMLSSAALTGKGLIDLYVLSGCASRVLELWSIRAALPDGAEAAPVFSKQLSLRQVGFTYGANFSMQDVSLTIRKGEVIGLVGPSGAGKSTLTDLILRLYDPTSGAVELDGMDIRRFTLGSYRRLFGIVSQESLLFNETIWYNIAYGLPDATDAAVQDAARVANAHNFIMELPQGYQTLVGDRGIRLSGGQRQRIAIARAIVRAPQLLIFDEATSSLDNESERLVQQAINRIMTNCTGIIVAHRLTTVQMCDRIIVLDGGRIVEEGTHESLLVGNGLYRRLAESQFADMAGAPVSSAAEAAA